MSGGATIHASCVAIGGRGVLIAGASGTGKSDLALRLIDRGAMLVCDDYCDLDGTDGRLTARAPATIAGRIEVRGLGIIALAHLPKADIALLVDLDTPAERMPEPATRTLEGVAVPMVALAALEASAPIKVEMALRELAR